MFFSPKTAMSGLVFVLTVAVLMGFASLEAHAAVELAIGSASGNEGETVDVPVYLSGSAMASTILFSISYDSNVLQYVSLQNGNVVDGITQWIISTPSVISKKVAVAVYGGGNYIHDGELCVVSFRVATSSSVGTTLASGGGASAASLTNATLPVVVMPGNVFANCEAVELQAPAGVTATQGEGAGVTISWGAVSGATAYQVYRANSDTLNSAQAVSGWVSGVTSWLDDTAAAPETVPFGCQGAAPAVTDYYYWVRAREAGGCPSEFSASAQGWRGEAKAFYPGDETYEKALPGRVLSEGLFEARESGPLALRLRTDQAVDPATVWGTASGEWGTSDAVRWVALEAGGGWVVFEPEDGLVAGERVLMTAGGSTIAGEALAPVTAEFVVVGAVEAADGLRPVAVEAPVALPTGLMPAWRVGQDELFGEPVRVMLPLPEGLGAGDVQLCYLKQSGEAAGWYAAEHVEGWLVKGSTEEVLAGGARYLSFEIAHSGVMQLRRATSDISAGATPLLGAVAALLGMGLMRRRNRK